MIVACEGRGDESGADVYAVMLYIIPLLGSGGGRRLAPGARAGISDF